MKIRPTLIAATMVAGLAPLAFAPAASAAPAAYYTVGADPVGSCTQRTFGPGAVGGCVRLIQWTVNLSIGSALATDGRYGPWTGVGAAVFEQGHGLAIDGIWGDSAEWPMACSELGFFAANGNTNAAVVRYYAGC